jgi:hypothetical protein
MLRVIGHCLHVVYVVCVRVCMCACRVCVCVSPQPEAPLKGQDLCTVSQRYVVSLPSLRLPLVRLVTVGLWYSEVPTYTSPPLPSPPLSLQLTREGLQAVLQEHVTHRIFPPVGVFASAVPAGSAGGGSAGAGAGAAGAASPTGAGAGAGAGAAVPPAAEAGPAAAASVPGPV